MFLFFKTLCGPGFWGVGGGGWAAHTSTTIEHIGMKLGRLAENHKLILNLIYS